MVIHAFPAAKLGALLLKQISKPIANYVKTRAKSHPTFRKYVCLPPAHFYNWCEKKSKMWLLRMGQPVNITVLNEADAIELGANLVGEAVIFVIAAGILLSEYNRSVRKEEAKEAAKKSEMQELQNTLRDLFIQTEEQATHIRELSRKLGEIETRNVHVILPPKSKPPEEPPSKPREPPQNYSSPKPESVINSEEVTNNIYLIEDNTYKPLKGIVLKTLDEVENELFDRNQKRKPGVITVALNHLYSNVYRTPLTF